MKATIICDQGALAQERDGFGATCAACASMLVIRPKIRRLAVKISATLICKRCFRAANIAAAAADKSEGGPGRRIRAQLDIVDPGPNEAFCLVRLEPDGTDWEDEEAPRAST